MQLNLPFSDSARARPEPLRRQLLKWVGNKQRFAPRIVSFFPRRFRTYFEPFLGSGAVLATLSPAAAVGSDAFSPLVEIWQTLASAPERLKQSYSERWELIREQGKEAAYEQIKQSFNTCPNGADLVFLCRACYGGIVRFRKADGYMSTPCGPQRPISPKAFAERVDQWHARVRRARFAHADFADAMNEAKKGDLVYCDPPYVDTQRILYGAQAFSVERLFEAIARCKARGARVALSIDGSKRSGDKVCDVPLPHGLFESEIAVDCGRSMLRRFQMAGKTLESEVVADRLLLTYALD